MSAAGVPLASGYLRADNAPTWAALQAHFEASGKSLDLREAFASDPQRVASLSQSAPHVFADMSKNLTDVATEKLLLALARECGLEAHRDAMFAGDHINTTEDRAVLHTLLRAPAGMSFEATIITRKPAPRTTQPIAIFCRLVGSRPRRA